MTQRQSLRPGASRWRYRSSVGECQRRYQQTGEQTSSYWPGAGIGGGGAIGRAGAESVFWCTKVWWCGGDLNTWDGQRKLVGRQANLDGDANVLV